MKNQPDYIKAGTKFKNKWIPEMDSEILSFDFTTNLLSVRLTPNENAPSYRQPFTEDGWDLAHTIHGFERGDYQLIEG